MAKSVTSRAEEKFAATQKKEKQFVKEKDKAWQELTERVAKQKALRLAKEAADKEVADQAAAEKASAAAKKAASKKKKASSSA
jgi:colicin import membrane protein